MVTRPEASLPKSIPHLEDLKPEQFARFVEALKAGNVEISEKLDGSARISFGFGGGTLWVASKNRPRVYEAKMWGTNASSRAIMAAHLALESASSELRGGWPMGLEALVAEVLHTPVPNTIEYGPDAIVVHGHVGSVSEEQVRAFVESIGKVGGWQLAYKSLVDPKVLPNLSDGLAPNHVAQRIVESFKGIQPRFGPVGGEIEGLVFRNRLTNEMVKVVDRESFTKLNRFLWHYRERLERGVKTEQGVWQPGVTAGFRNALAEQVFQHPTLKSPVISSRIIALKRENLDRTLAEYIKKNSLAPAGFLERASAALQKTTESFVALGQEWFARRNEDIVVEIKGKRRSMHNLQKERTDAAFWDTARYLKSTRESLEKIKEMKGELTQKTALLKMFLGPNRLEKLALEFSPASRFVESVISSLREDEGGFDLTWDDAGGAPSKLPQNKPGDEEGFQKGVDPEQGEELLKIHADNIKKKRGFTINNPRLLGKGTRGAAYSIGGGKVAKVTNDKTEAVAMQKVKDGKFKHVVRVFDVFRFRDTELFCIVQEELKPLDVEENNELNGIIGTTALPKMLELHGGQWEPAREAMIQMFHKQMDSIQDPQEKKDYDAQVRGHWKLMKDKYGIVDMVKELEKNGITFFDFHGGNVMKRQGGEYVLIDLGFSKVSGGKDPDVLETVLKEIAVVGEGEDKEGYSDIQVAKYAKLLSKHGIKIGKELGRGAKGVASEATWNGKTGVLKLTEDVSEAKSSNHIKGKKLKHVVHIYEVFRIPDTDVFGIFQERLQPISDKEGGELNRVMDVISYARAGNEMFKGNTEGIIKKVAKLFGMQKIGNELNHLNYIGIDMDEFVDLYQKFDMDGMFKELASQGIEFADYHPGNMMKRGSDYVVIDLGMSRSPGAEPKALEGIVKGVVESLVEGRADTVGVTLGRFQPFHKGHGEMIRSLTAKFDKVLVVVAGNTKDERNPFSFDLRVDIMKKSLPDVWSKIEVHRAQFNGKSSGFLPGVLSDIIQNKNSVLEADVAVNVLVGEDRFEEIQEQFRKALAHREAGNQTAFDPSMATVVRLPDVKVDSDDADRISASAVRQALAKGDQATFEKLMDPHLVSNQPDLEEAYAQLRSELGLDEELHETLADVGGESTIEQIAQKNSSLLKRKFGIDVSGMQKLGNGMDGVAYDIGNSKVLKITTDVGEAKASFSIRGKDKKHIAKVFDAFRFREDDGKGPIFGIILEKLQKLSPEEAREYRSHVEPYIFEDPRRRALDLLPSADSKRIKAAVLEYIREEVHESWGIHEGPFNSSTDPAITLPARKRTKGNDKKKSINANVEVEKKYQLFLAAYDKFQVEEILVDIRDAGIVYKDLHSGNLMKRGSDYVATDLGRSESGGKEPPVAEIVEQMMKAVIDRIGSKKQSQKGKKARRARKHS